MIDDRDELARHLLNQAEQLIRGDGKKPSYKRRAVSCAYYAIFHAIGRLCADCLATAEAGMTVSYERVYRSLDHNALRTSFFREPLRSSAEMQTSGAKIAQLQGARHEADYAIPRAFLFTRSECREHITEARKVIESLASLSGQQRRTLAICLHFKDRKA